MTATGTSSWTFLHVNDSHMGTARSYRFRPAINKRWSAIKRQMAGIDADLLLHGGDLTRDGETHEFEYLQAREDLDDLPFPTFVIPGNMDVGNKREDLEYIVELAFVCPKSQDQSRKFGAYLLPHSLQTVNMQLLDNPEYYDRCVIYDISHDQKGHAILQDLKPTFKKVGSDHAELVIVYDKDYYDEEHQ